MLLTCFILKKIMKKMMPSRHNGAKVLKFFTEKDYTELNAVPFSFKCGKNTLRGFKYSYGEPPYKAALILFHGIGAGHYAYESEIRYFAHKGYLVYAYDNSCCVLSDGEGWWNLASSMVDQKAFFAWLETDEDAKGLPRYAIGHSWGGFTVLGALRPEYNIDKVCCISGFGKVADVMATNMPKYRLLRPLFAEMTYLNFGKLGGMNYYKLVRDTDKPVLMFHGDKDEIVHYKDHFLKCKKIAGKNPHVTFVTCPGRRHNPYLTKEGEDYYLKLVDDGVVTGVAPVIPEIDYDLLTQCDPELHERILKFFDGEN